MSSTTTDVTDEYTEALNEIERLTANYEGRCSLYDALEKREAALVAEGAIKDSALNLAWEALRWADSPDELDDGETWTEIPADRAIAAFDAVWKEMGEQIP